MYGTRYVFSRNFFRGWVVVTFLIGWAASLVILIMPLWQGRAALRTFGGFLAGGRRKEDVSTGTDTRTSESDETIEELGNGSGVEKLG